MVRGCRTTPQALELVMRAIEAAGLRPGEDVTLALDVASTHFYDGRSYRLAATGGEQLTAAELIDYLGSAHRAVSHREHRRPLGRGRLGRAGSRSPRGWVSACGWSATTCSRPTSRDLQKGIELGAGNSVLIKVNQIGTLTETLQAIALARAAGYGYVVSARSGETEDTTIADLAVATAADVIKIGSIVRGERLAKYNQLLRIAEEV